MFKKNASPEFKRFAVGIIIVGCIAMYFSSCLVTDALNVIQPAFISKFNWSYSEISTPITIGGYLLIVVSFLYSTIMIKNGTRLFGTVCFASTAVGSFLVGISYGMENDSYILFFIGIFLTKLATYGIQMLTFQLCATWFHKSRGRVLGVITMAAPLNSATSTTLLTIGKDSIGFEFTYYIIGVILIIATVLAYIFARTTPEEMGLTVDGLLEESVKTDKDESKDEKAALMSMKEILSKATTWKLTITFGIFSATLGPVMAFFMSRMAEVNVSTPTALKILTAASLLGICFSYLYGWIDDKFGTFFACRILGIGYVLMLLCFYFGGSDNLILVILAGVGMASMTGGTPNLHPSAIVRAFGPKEYQNANRYITIGVTLISSYGMQLMSNVTDATGSFDMGYIIFAALALVATISIWTTKKVVQ